ncbi:MAG: hypothetical protein K2M52_00585 [Paramuribaculum sp.]|nr:hypothetical protein [Paramuribaculum sp.]
MKRKLIKQIRHEWRTNLWMSIELLIVSVIVWFITDYLFVIAQTVNEPKGYDIDNTFLLEFGTLPEHSPRYVAVENGEEQDNLDRMAIYEVIKNNPDVESVSMSSCMEPGLMNWMGTTVLINDDDSASISVRAGEITPSHIKTIGIKAKDPKISQDDLIKMLEDGKALISDFVADNKKLSHPMNPESLVGANIGNYGENKEVGAVIEYLKRVDTEIYKRDIILVTGMSESNPETYGGWKYLSVRVKPSATKDFISNFNKDRDRLYSRNNTFISSIKSYQDQIEETNRDMNVTKRKYIGCMVFMLVSIFLGLLGTFWFRTRQRVPEIAIRKVNGASNQSIVLRLASEAIFLLTLVTPLAAVGDWLICHYELNMNIRNEFFVPSRLVITIAITYGIILLTILAGIAYPAWRAVKVQPAEALKDE